MIAPVRGVLLAALTAPAVAHAEEPAEPQVPATGFAWQPFGYLRMQYIAVQNDPDVAFVGRDDGFELQNARVGARGQLGTAMAFVISIDGAVDERTLASSPQAKLAVGLRDAYVDTSLSGPIVVRTGYFQCWLDPQAQIPDTVREFVDYPIETRGMRASEGWQTPGLPPGRSIGAAIRLDPAEPDDGASVGFELAAQNGADEYSVNDAGDRLALSAAGIVRFAHDGWLVAAGRWNPRAVGGLPYRENETDLQGSLGAHAAAGPVSLGAAVIFQHTTFETTGAPSQTAYGGHAQAMVRLPIEYPVSMGYRFGILDPEASIITGRLIEHAVGAVLALPAVRTRLQLQLVHVVEQAGRDLQNDRVQLGVEVVL